MNKDIAQMNLILKNREDNFGRYLDWKDRVFDRENTNEKKYRR
jgi:hypothetical protein